MVRFESRHVCLGSNLLRAVLENPDVELSRSSTLGDPRPQLRHAAGTNSVANDIQTTHLSLNKLEEAIDSAVGL